MNALEIFRRSDRRRRKAEFIAAFAIALTVAVGLIGLLAASARAGIGCATRSIAVSSSECGTNPGPAAHAPAEARVVFEADSSQAQR